MRRTVVAANLLVLVGCVSAPTAPDPATAATRAIPRLQHTMDVWFDVRVALDGADVNQRGPDGLTALGLAVHDHDKVGLLLAAGADGLDAWAHARRERNDAVLAVLPPQVPITDRPVCRPDADGPAGSAPRSPAGACLGTAERGAALHTERDVATVSVVTPRPFGGGGKRRSVRPGELAASAPGRR